MTREEVIEELKGCIIAEERGKDGKPNGNITCDLTRDTLDMAINALEQEPTTKNDLGVDCISRADVLNHLANIAKVKAKSDVQKALMGRCLYMVENLPSVTPQEPFKPMVEIDLYSVIKQKYIEREVLDKIRAEIMELDYKDYDGEEGTNIPPMIYRDHVFDILDKYKGESD